MMQINWKHWKKCKYAVPNGTMTIYTTCGSALVGATETKNIDIKYEKHYFVLEKYMLLHPGKFQGTGMSNRSPNSVQ